MQHVRLVEKQWEPSATCRTALGFSHLQDGDLREVLLLKVGMCDELQLGLKEAVEGLQEEGHALIVKAGR